jgi:predicted amidohydrolase
LPATVTGQSVAPRYGHCACSKGIIAPMHIGIAQASPTFGERDRNISRALHLIGGERADLWVLPELFASGYQFVSASEVRTLAEPVPDGPTTEALIEHARDHDCFLVAGLPESDGQWLFNSAVLVGPDGFLTCYRKVHLFYEEKRYFSPGDRSFPVVDVGFCRIGLMVCFDHLFPESARSLALQGADVIAHPANLVMPDLAQRTMRVRAIENGVFTATANRVGEESRTSETLAYTGQSQVVGPDGEVLVRLSKQEVETAVVEIDVERARDKRITEHNDKLADRRPDQYRL